MKALALVGLVAWLSPAALFLAWVAVERVREWLAEREWRRFVAAHPIQWEVPA